MIPLSNTCISVLINSQFFRYPISVMYMRWHILLVTLTNSESNILTVKLLNTDTLGKILWESKVGLPCLIKKKIKYVCVSP